MYLFCAQMRIHVWVEERVTFCTWSGPCQQLYSREMHGGCKHRIEFQPQKDWARFPDLNDCDERYNADDEQNDGPPEVVVGG